MRRLRSFTLAVSLTALSVSAAPHFDVRSSRLQSFLQFIDLLNDSNATSKTKEAFLGSAYNNSKFQKLLAEYEEIQRSALSLDALGQSRRSLLWSQSLFAKNLDDFSLRTLGIVAAASHQRFFNVFSEFLPVYERLFWEKHSEKGERVRYNLEGTLNNWHLGALFDSLRKFLHAAWPDESSFFISLMPEPDSKGFLGTSYFQTGLALRYGLDDYSPKDLFAPLVRGVSQSLIRNQMQDYRRELESDFQSFSSIRHSVFAKDDFADQISLAFAYFYAEKNGYAFSLNHEISDAEEKSFTEALSKEVGIMLSRERALNRDFVQKYVTLYKEHFPNAIYERNNIFRHVAILTDNESLRAQKPHEILKQVSAKTDVELLSLSLDRLQVLKPGDPRTVIYLVTEQDSANTKKYFAVNPFLSTTFSKLQKSPGAVILRSFDASGRAFYFVKIRKAEQLNKAFERLKDFVGKGEALQRL